MERGIYDRIRRALRELGRRRLSGRHRYTDAGILEVYLWAAIHDRPVSWACDANHWPPGARRGPLPDASTVSRRMRSPRITALRERVRKRLEGRTESGLVAVVDGKALPIGPHSHDRQSGYGRSASGKARGYKLHAMIDAQGAIISWRVAPMHVDERTMARRMLREIERPCYLLADGNYDANRLFDAALQRGVQLVAPRRYGSAKSMGHRRHSPARLRSKELLEHEPSGFARDLMRERWTIERFFGQLCSAPGGLGHLPAWVRSWRRVHHWVGAKLLIHAARRSLRTTALMQ
jgi:hypothetical protein